jgi:hypothetical protein
VSTNSYAPPTADIDARGRTALIVGVLGLVACGIGFAIDRGNFFRAWLIGYMLWLGVSLGSMGLMMVHHLSGGGWGMVVRRVFEASSKTLPLMAVLFVPVVLGMQTLYPWTHPDLVAADEILQHKALYLNTPFFLGRAVFYFAGWILLAWLLGRMSRAQDEGDDGATERMRRLSGGGLVFYAFTVTARSAMCEVTRHGGRLWRNVRPYPFVRKRGSSIANTPRSVVLRIKRPSPCFNAIIACGTLYS